MKKIISLCLSALLFVSALCFFISCEKRCEHVWGEEVIANEATCSRSGVSHVYCQKCGESQRNVIPKLPHTYSDKWSFDGTYHWHDATCEHSGEISHKALHEMEDGVCQVCNMALVSQGLAYKGNLGEGTYRVTGIGTTLDANVIVARYYKEYEIVAVDDGAFSAVKGLKSVTLQEYIKSIGDRAFADNAELTYVEFTSGLEYLGADVIDNCPLLEKIVFRGTKAEWHSLEKADNWQGNATGFTVNCSDGRIEY